MTLSISSKNQKVRTLYKVKEVPGLPEFAWLTESKLRHLIYQSQSRLDSDGKVTPGNGMVELGVIKRIGTKSILIDVEKLQAWVNGERAPADLTMDMR